MPLWRRLLRYAVEPRSAERLRLTAERWQSLAEPLRTPQQVAGSCWVACGATHGVIERCDFGCTSCYLTDLANTTPQLPLDAVKRQLDELRRHLGPAGKTQITSGEVTLLPTEELGEIVAYARQIGLDPMVMSHGDTWMKDPESLRRLVADYGLEKISVHIDSTQRGRSSHKRGASEEELHAVRDQFADLVRRIRRQTGRNLRAAHTVTVTPDNLESVPGIVDWALDNADAFRMISFQPVAEIGRTRDRRIGDDEEVDMLAVWKRICAATECDLDRHALHFGHPECNIVHPLFVVSFGNQREIVESVRRGNRWDRWIMARGVATFGGIGVVGSTIAERVVRNLSMMLRHPALLLALPFYGLYRLWGMRRLALAAALQLLKLKPVRVQALAFVIHRFMDAEELSTPLGQERLDACVFKLPVDGKLVSMCQMNASGLRRQLNLEARARASQKHQERRSLANM